MNHDEYLDDRRLLPQYSLFLYTFDDQRYCLLCEVSLKQTSSVSDQTIPLPNIDGVSLYCSVPNSVSNQVYVGVSIAEIMGTEVTDPGSSRTPRRWSPVSLPPR